MNSYKIVGRWFLNEKQSTLIFTKEISLCSPEQVHFLLLLLLNLVSIQCSWKTRYEFCTKSKISKNLHNCNWNEVVVPQQITPFSRLGIDNNYNFNIHKNNVPSTFM